MYITPVPPTLSLPRTPVATLSPPHSGAHTPRRAPVSEPPTPHPLVVNSTTAASAAFDMLAFPHLYETILDHVPLPTLLSVRAASHTCRAMVDRRLARHLVVRARNQRQGLQTIPIGITSTQACPINAPNLVSVVDERDQWDALEHWTARLGGHVRILDLCDNVAPFILPPTTQRLSNLTSLRVRGKFKVDLCAFNVKKVVVCEGPNYRYVPFSLSRCSSRLPPNLTRLVFHFQCHAPVSWPILFPIVGQYTFPASLQEVVVFVNRRVTVDEPPRGYRNLAVHAMGDHTATMERDLQGLVRLGHEWASGRMGSDAATSAPRTLTIVDEEEYSYPCRGPRTTFHCKSTEALRSALGGDPEVAGVDLGFVRFLTREEYVKSAPVDEWHVERVWSMSHIPWA